MGWPGEKQRHMMSSRGVRTAEEKEAQNSRVVLPGRRLRSPHKAQGVAKPGELDPELLQQSFQRYWVAKPEIHDKGNLQEVLEIYDYSTYDFLNDNPFIIDMMVGVETPEEAESKISEIWGSLDDFLESEPWIVDVIHAAYSQENLQARGMRHKQRNPFALYDSPKRKVVSDKIMMAIKKKDARQTRDLMDEHRNLGATDTQSRDRILEVWEELHGKPTTKQFDTIWIGRY